MVRIRSGRGALTVVALAVAFALPVAAPAMADPSSCSSSYSGSASVTSYCYSGAPGSQFRAVAECKYTTPSGSTDYNNYYGAWKTQGAGSNSVATCASGWSRYGKTTQTK